MIHPQSEVYLANPAVAAASAILGRIASPEEVKNNGSNKLKGKAWKVGDDVDRLNIAALFESFRGRLFSRTLFGGCNS